MGSEAAADLSFSTHCARRPANANADGSNSITDLLPSSNDGGDATVLLRASDVRFCTRNANAPENMPLAVKDGS
jgi:hypothetical protein